MITIGGISVGSLQEILDTWTKDGHKYTSQNGEVFITIYDDVKISEHCSLGYGCFLGYDCSLGNDCEENIPPLWFSGPRYSIGFYSPGLVNSGCITKPIKWWEENIKRHAEEHNYTPEQVKEYVWRVKVLADWMKLHNVYDLPAKEIK